MRFIKHTITTLFTLMVCLLCGMQVNAASGSKVVVEQEDAAVGYGVAYITWTTYIDADGYNVYTSEDGTTSWETYHSYENDRTGSSTCLCMKPGETIYVKVVPYVTQRVEGSWTKMTGWEYENVEVADAASDPVKIIAGPETVTSIKQIKATTKSATVTWDKAAGATAYRIYDKYGKFLMQTASTKATVKVSAGQSKRFEICAVRQNGTFVAKGYRTSFSVIAAPSKVECLADVSEETVSWPDYSMITSNPAHTTTQVGWQQNANDDYTVDGYKVMIYSVDGKKKLKTMTVKATSNPYVTFNLKAVWDKGCRIRVAGYIKLNGKIFYGQWAAKTLIPQARIQLKVKNKKSVKLTWEKVANATKYTIYVCKDLSALEPKFYKLKTVGKNVTSYTVKNILKKNKNTGFYVVPTVKIKGKTYTVERMWYESAYYGMK